MTLHFCVVRGLWFLRGGFIPCWIRRVCYYDRYFETGERRKERTGTILNSQAVLPFLFLSPSLQNYFLAIRMPYIRSSYLCNPPPPRNLIWNNRIICASSSPLSILQISRLPIWIYLLGVLYFSTFFFLRLPFLFVFVPKQAPQLCHLSSEERCAGIFNICRSPSLARHLFLKTYIFTYIYFNCLLLLPFIQLLASPFFCSSGFVLSPCSRPLLQTYPLIPV